MTRSHTTGAAGRAPTADRLRHDIYSGRNGDKIDNPDAAPSVRESSRPIWFGLLAVAGFVIVIVVIAGFP